MQIMQLSLKEIEKSNKAVRTVIGAESTLPRFYLSCYKSDIDSYESRGRDSFRTGSHGMVFMSILLLTQALNVSPKFVFISQALISTDELMAPMIGC